jgi:hypothetical protein
LLQAPRRIRLRKDIRESASKYYQRIADGGDYEWYFIGHVAGNEAIPDLEVEFRDKPLRLYRYTYRQWNRPLPHQWEQDRPMTLLEVELYLNQDDANRRVIWAWSRWYPAPDPPLDPTPEQAAANIEEWIRRKNADPPPRTTDRRMTE